MYFYCVILFSHVFFVFCTLSSGFLNDPVSTAEVIVLNEVEGWSDGHDSVTILMQVVMAYL
jgi:hypothetical protein